MDAQPILKGRLISLTRVDGHARWVSPAVLELIGDLPETVDGGVIVRDEHGTATGALFEVSFSVHCARCSPTLQAYLSTMRWISSPSRRGVRR